MPRAGIKRRVPASPPTSPEAPDPVQTDYEPPQHLVDQTAEPPTATEVPAQPPEPGAHYFDTLGGRKTTTAERFFEHLPTFPRDRFERAIIYLYRLWPRINRKQTDPTAYNYIDKYPGPVTPDEIKQRWGEGKYQALMLNLDKRTDNQIAACTFTIEDPTCPPVLNVAELVLGVPINASYEEYLRSRNMHPSQSQPGNNAGADASATAALANIAQEALRSARQPQPAQTPKLDEVALQGYINLLSNAQKQPTGMDPTGLAALVTAIGSLTKPAAPAGPDPRDQLINTLLSSLIQNANRPPAPASSLTETLASVASIMELSKQLAPANSGAESVLNVLAGNAAPILGEVRGIVQGIAAMVRPRSAEQPGQEQPTNNPANRQVTQGENAVDQMQMALSVIEPVLIKQFREGAEGWMLAEWIENGWGADSYQRIANQGRDALISAMMTRPALRNLFEGLQPQLTAYVESFLQWPEQRAQLEQDGPAPASEEAPTA